jgi:hypothetical protein
VTGDNDLAQAFRYQALDKTGKTRSATANHCCVEGIGMAVGFVRWLQCADTIPTADGIAITIGNDVIAPLRREEFTPSRAGIATGAGVKTSTNDRRNNVLRTREHAHALHHGGAID